MITVERYISRHLDYYLDKYQDKMHVIPLNSLYNIFFHQERKLEKEDKAYKFITGYSTTNTMNTNNNNTNTSKFGNYILLQSLDCLKMSRSNGLDAHTRIDEHCGFLPKNSSMFFKILDDTYSLKEQENESIKEKLQKLTNCIEGYPIEELTDERITSLCEQVTKSKNIKDIVNKHLPDAKEDIKKIDSTLTSLFDQGIHLKESNNNLKKKLDDAITSNENLTKELGEAKELIENFNKELGEAKESKDNLTKELGEAKESNDNLTKELGEANESNDNLIKELGEAKEIIDNLTKELGEAKESNDNLTKELGEAKESNDNLTKELGEVKESNDNLTKELVDDKEIIENLTKKFEKVLDSNKCYFKELEEAKASNNELRKKLEVSKESNYELRKEFYESIESNYKLKIEFEVAKISNDELTKELERANEYNNSLRIELEKANESNEILTRELGESNESNDKLRKVFEETNASNDELRKELCEANKSNDELRKELCEANKSNDKLRKELKAAKAYNDELTKELKISKESYKLKELLEVLTGEENLTPERLQDLKYKFNDIKDKAKKDKSLLEELQKQLPEDSYDVKSISSKLESLQNDSEKLREAQGELCRFVCIFEGRFLEDIKTEELTNDKINSLCYTAWNSQKLKDIVNKYLPESKDDNEAIDSNLFKLIDESKKLKELLEVLTGEENLLPERHQELKDKFNDIKDKVKIGKKLSEDSYKFKKDRELLCKLINCIDGFSNENFENTEFNEEKINALCNNAIKAKNIKDIINKYLPDTHEDDKTIDSTLHSLIDNTSKLRELFEILKGEKNITPDKLDELKEHFNDIKDKAMKDKLFSEIFQNKLPYEYNDSFDIQNGTNKNYINDISIEKEKNEILFEEIRKQKDENANLIEELITQKQENEMCNNELTKQKEENELLNNELFELAVSIEGKTYDDSINNKLDEGEISILIEKANKSRYIQDMIIELLYLPIGNYNDISNALSKFFEVLQKADELLHITFGQDSNSYECEA